MANPDPRFPAEAVPHRRVGLIGGTTWRSTALYYERLNRACETRFGSRHSFAGLLWNFDYADVLACLAAQGSAGVEARFVEAAQRLAAAGCEIVALTAVTAHLWHAPVSAAGTFDAPHILDAVARRLDAMGVGAVGVLGTHLTTGAGFLGDRLGQRRIVLPTTDEQAELDALIDRLGATDCDAVAERALLRTAIDRLVTRGADAVLLACTELPLLLPMPECGVPLIDCVSLHVDDICQRIVSDSHAR
jgi:aspartate racemase